MDLFNTAPVVVKQPKRYFVDKSEYFCYDTQGRQIAHVHEADLGAGMQALRFMAKNTTGFARTVRVDDAWGRPRLVIEKKWSMWTAQTVISVPGGPPIGYIDQDFKLFKAGFRLLDPYKRHLGTIKGDFWGFDFEIVDANEHPIAKVNRHVADLGELFTAADTYVLWPRYPNLPEPLKTLVVASGITVDLVLAEGQR
ncbi:LURP-one-related/scramblase family protein [Murinocardiopsis flavida]|uniref:LURP-one-related/scramblase family protein n=1 Tax=Murinocardiopsis flavida TaxID=645275 RepID=UPI000D0D8CD5|nr:phospholipid scramblase-related protein [Murinocardiopsis flavida]